MSEPEYVFDDPRDDIMSRARSARISCEIGEWSLDDETDPDTHYLELRLPNGRNTRPLVLSREQGAELAKYKFEYWTFLGDYNAFLDRDHKSIEALVEFSSSTRLADVLMLPGAEVFAADSTGEGQWYPFVYPLASDNKDEFISRAFSSKTQWRLLLRADHAPISIELSLATPQYDAVGSVDLPIGRLQRSTLKLLGVSSDRHDDALELLESYSSSFFFELDLRFNLSMSLSRRRNRPFEKRERRYGHGRQPIDLPRRRYAREATSLYMYARTASSAPLQQYLAYYQAIEFYFPSFVNAGAISRIRNELRDPRFDIEVDSKLQRIVQIATRSAKGASPEKDQLRETLVACLDEESLREFIRSVDDMRESLEKKDYIKGVPEIKVDSALVDSLAERIYRIRCRIVHTKEAGGPNFANVLLPYSAEANRLGHDLRLIRYISQKVIIAASSGTLWV